MIEAEMRYYYYYEALGQRDLFTFDLFFSDPNAKQNRYRNTFLTIHLAELWNLIHFQKQEIFDTIMPALKAKRDNNTARVNNNIKQVERLAQKYTIPLLHSDYNKQNRLLRKMIRATNRDNTDITNYAYYLEQDGEYFTSERGIEDAFKLMEILGFKKSRPEHMIK